jgi:FKBP-type peptidyl-prolyl cis-trans isomerase 2
LRDIGDDKMPVKEGDKVKVEYTGTFDDGTVFDTSVGKEPLGFKVGSKMVVPGFEKAIIGMDVGEEKEFKLQPAEAYGERSEQLIKKVPKEHLPKEAEIKAGMTLMAALPNGAQIPVLVAEVGDTEATLDMNHPLAGKVLNFKIKVVEINAA